MKTLFTFLAIVFLITTLQAKIVYLNNNLPNPDISENLYTNWADAYAACSAGDTIYILGSNNSYGSISIDKTLTIIGPGYFLNRNQETQLNKKMAEFQGLDLESGSDGTTLLGISLVNRNTVGAQTAVVDINENINDITIENCFLDYVRLSYNSNTFNDNVSIKKCFIDRFRMSGKNSGLYNNLTVTNNIVVSGVEIPNGSNGVITNNVFISSYLILGVTSSFEFVNNIYLNENENDFTIQPLPDASVHHNISLSGAFGDANDNFTAPQSTLFVSGNNASTDGQYMLSENSPAKGAGSNGTDIGPFGGPDPYRLSGLPNLPNIYELSTGGFVSGDNLSVQIKIKQ